MLKAFWGCGTESEAPRSSALRPERDRDTGRRQAQHCHARLPGHCPLGHFHEMGDHAPQPARYRLNLLPHLVQDRRRPPFPRPLHITLNCRERRRTSGGELRILARTPFLQCVRYPQDLCCSRANLLGYPQLICCILTVHLQAKCVLMPLQRHGDDVHRLPYGSPVLTRRSSRVIGPARRLLGSFPGDIPRRGRIRDLLTSARRTAIQSRSSRRIRPFLTAFGARHATGGLVLGADTIRHSAGVVQAGAGARHATGGLVLGADTIQHSAASCSGGRARHAAGVVQAGSRNGVRLRCPLPFPVRARLAAKALVVPT